MKAEQPKITAKTEPPVPGEPLTIRDRLESDAWKNHPQFAAVQALKPTRKPPGRPLKWQDRALLALSALLLLLLIFRVETANAQQDRWDLEFRDDGGSQRSLALNTGMQVDVTVPAIDMALNLPPHAGLLRQVVFITDGSVGNEGELPLQIGEELGGTLGNGEIPNLLPAGSSAYEASFSQAAIGWVAQLVLSFITLLVATGMLLLTPSSSTGYSGSASSPMATSPPSS